VKNENMNDNKCEKNRILVVDDEAAFKELICYSLRDDYEMHGAGNAAEALRVLSLERFDLVLSDVSMPGMNGPELLAKVKEMYPGTKIALMTAWSIDECLNLALEYGIGNIVPKKMPFDMDEIKSAVERLLSEDVFGLDRYFAQGTTILKKSLRVTPEMDAIRSMAEDLMQGLPKEKRIAITMVLEEAVVNASRHPRHLNENESRDLGDDEKVDVLGAMDPEKIGFAVIDGFGQLETKTILSNLEKCIHPSDESLRSTEGRGLFLIWSFVDRMIINIKKGVRTEIIMLVYREQRPRDQRPLLITEL